MGKMRNRGRKRRKEAERAAHDDLSDDELDAALAEIAAGSDRVAAIMGAALVQNTLMGALVTCLKNKGDLDKVFDSIRGPLNSFYGQIVMGKAFGLFDEKTANALHTVRSIRNKFAHAAVSLSFEEAEVTKKCAGLAHLENTDAEADGKSKQRIQYEHACYELTCQLIAAGTENVQRYADGLKHAIAWELLQRREGRPGLNALLALIPPSDEGRE
jgi:hypothetical protein